MGQPDDISVGILVGGASRRMGRPKATMDVDGESMVERTIRAARRCVGNVALLGTPPFELNESLGSIDLIPDAIPNAGPIGGLLGLMRSTDSRAVLLLACDMPFIEHGLLQRLIDESELHDADAVVPTTGEGGNVRRHPCCALYQRSALRAVQSAVDAGEYGMRRLLDRMRVVWLAVEGDDALQLTNWNEPSDVKLPTTN